MQFRVSQVGDVLHEIDGHVVYRKPVLHIAPLILGLVIQLRVSDEKVCCVCICICAWRLQLV